MSDKKGHSFMSTWLKVDEKNREVEYQADPQWLKNANSDEQNKAFTKLAGMADAYRQAGYRIIDIVKSVFEE
jgi:predicted alpha/beta superfamily hydrolase